MKIFFTNLLFLLLIQLMTGCSGEEGHSPIKTASQSGNGVQAIVTAEAATAAKPVENAAKMAPTPAVVTRDTELKEKPFVDAKTLKRLPARTSVAIADRSGGWVKVTSAGQQGWVRMLHVSSQSSAAGGTNAKDLEAAAKMATGRAGSGNIVSTTGIRGLSEEQLREAKPNPAELQRLDGYAVNKEQATAYARANKLEQRQLAYLPTPK